MRTNALFILIAVFISINLFSQKETIIELILDDSKSHYPELKVVSVGDKALVGTVFQRKSSSTTVFTSELVELNLNNFDAINVYDSKSKSRSLIYGTITAIGTYFLGSNLVAGNDFDSPVPILSSAVGFSVGFAFGRSINRRSFNLPNEYSESINYISDISQL